MTYLRTLRIPHSLLRFLRRILEVFSFRVVFCEISFEVFRFCPAVGEQFGCDVGVGRDEFCVAEVARDVVCAEWEGVYGCKCDFFADAEDA